MSVGTASGIRGREWEYDLGTHGVSGIIRRARKCELSTSFPDKAQADLLRHVSDRDVTMRTPGKLSLDGWEQSAYIVKSEINVISRTSLAMTLTVVLLDGVWRKQHVVQFSSTEESGGEWLNLPHDMPYDLAGAPALDYLEITGWTDSPIGFRVYGPASEPVVTIGNNRYAVHAYVPAGGYLDVDPLTASVKVTDSQGNITDHFGDAERGSGEGGGNYIFERLDPGTYGMSWDRSFGLDVFWWEEEGEPPWLLLSQTQE